MHPNLVSGQVSGVDDNSGLYEMNVDELVIRTDLLESNLNQYLHKWICVLYVSSF